MTGAGGPFEPGTRIGDFDVRALAGRGRAAEVYSCHRGQEHVAVKVFHDEVCRDAELRARVRRGALRAERLSHRHLVHTYETGTHGDRVFVVTGWVPGTSLDRVIASGRRPSPGKAARIVEQLARAVAACHHDGVVHGALVPKAVLIDSRTDEPLLDDLERPLSAELGDDCAANGYVVRDLDYGAPWDIEAQQFTPSGDLHALACVLHALVVGRAPRRDGPAHRRVSDQIPTRLRTVILRALADSPGDRYPSASAMAHDLDDVASSLRALPPLSTRSRTGPPRSGERPRFAIALRGVFGVLATGGAIATVWAVAGDRAASRSLPLSPSSPPPRGGAADRFHTAAPRTRSSGASPDVRLVHRQGDPGNAPAGMLTPRLVPGLPAAWTPIVIPKRRTDRLVLRVPGVGWVAITYWAGNAPPPITQLRTRYRRDRRSERFEPLAEPRRIVLRSTRVAAYARRTNEGRVQVVHQLRAHHGQYRVVVEAADRSVATRLAETASRTILRSSR